MDFSNISIYQPVKTDGQWLLKDHLGALRVRSAIGRNSYSVKAGLYKIGNPDKESEVIVTSNYKLTFDIIRRTLSNKNMWILVLNTFGVNVWCAAGKGTFGTEELVNQIKETNLHNYVSHKRIIVPQLGAPGIAAYEVKKQTGFNIKYGPVRAEDIISFIDSGYKKTEQMRLVTFKAYERFILTGVEISNSFKYYLIALIALMLISGLSKSIFSLQEVFQGALYEFINLSTAYLSGALFAPVLLPYLPSRYFSIKGLIMGIIGYGILYSQFYLEANIYYNIAWFAISAAVSSFLAMNFTGASTFTSLSGVRKEMKIFVPVQVILLLTGLVLLIISNFK